MDKALPVGHRAGAPPTFAGVVRVARTGPRTRTRGPGRGVVARTRRDYQDTQEQVVIEETLLEAEEKMEKAVVVAKEDFAAIRTGRAHPAMFNKIVADYYGALTPINQLASFSVPEPRMAVVTPFDKSALRNIEQAIRDSDLGVNPSNDGNIIRVVFPELTEERRREFIKVAKGKAEDSRISIRSVRRKAKEAIDKLIKDGEVGEDEGRRAEKELDDTTAKYVAQVDELLKHKEAELLEV
ncbi:ribosome recycling factor [Streptomyces spongiicola]|uniref:Ribosome-recycling factor n=1 Tax=Streptomyces spongiicola TaxID=1690221 RepID=A0A388T031_9ACTN|nr:ribosome recycling factor [Streptomyces spongiicola]